MKSAFVDAFSGISGDMFLGALVDLGVNLDILRQSLTGLDLPDPYFLSSSTVKKGSLRATQVEVRLDAPQSNSCRCYADIVDLIESSRLSSRVKRDSQSIFQVLAQAESRTHDVDLAEVHFHEIGAVDSLVDIIGAAVGLEILGIERLYASPLPMSSGMVQSQHGLIPLPSPATLQILGTAGAPTRPSSAQVELVTPTGAAILAALAKFEQPALRLSNIGVGAGAQDLPWPNIIRILVGEEENPSQDGLVLMETNIDDMNPQAFGHVMSRLFTDGALDVFLTPISMKKNRPATLLGVIARRSQEAVIAKRILEETSTLGVRVQPITRYEAQRSFCTVKTNFGDVSVKEKVLDGQVIQAHPEYDDCARLADQFNVPFLTVYQAAAQAYAVEHPSGSRR